MLTKKVRLVATSLEELLVVLVVTGILTLILMDAWRMLNRICSQVTKGAEEGIEIIDSLSYDKEYIQESLKYNIFDSLRTIQISHEKTIE